MLTSRDIAKMLDHSTLQPFLTEKDIRHGCEVAIKYGTATVCARPQDMEIVVPMLNGTGVLPCTVIGFPHGAHTMEIKAMEAARALEDGCRELDMVINIGRMLGGDYDYVEREIKALAELCHDQEAILKVIIETCLLTDEEKIAMCKAVTDAHADYIKTSTGFSKAGATFEDVELFKKHVGKDVKIKAAGGIASLDDAEKFLSLGADRLGTSRIVKIAKANENK
mgnify:CR=1 FL=1